MDLINMRVQKYISDCGIMSRRAAEKEIQAGRILINGEPAVLGQKITPDTDEVKYNGNIIKQAVNKRYNYVMLNKPIGYVTTMSDEKGRKCIAELISDYGSRIYPIGRLDVDSEGLLLLTDDGELTNKLTHPKHHIPKIYLVKIDKEITADELKAMNAPMVIYEGETPYQLQPVLTEVVTLKDGYTVLRMTLYEGRNRQIRKMCVIVGLTIISLKRVAVGKITLGDLRPGKWQRLTGVQIDYLKREV